MNWSRAGAEAGERGGCGEVGGAGQHKPSWVMVRH